MLELSYRFQTLHDDTIPLVVRYDIDVEKDVKHIIHHIIIVVRNFVFLIQFLIKDEGAY